MPPRRRNTIELCGERLPISQDGNRRHSHAQLIAYHPSTKKIHAADNRINIVRISWKYIPRTEKLVEIAWLFTKYKILRDGKYVFPSKYLLPAH